MFSKNFTRQVYDVIVKSEKQSLESDWEQRGFGADTIWSCSSSHADWMRKVSWGPGLVRVTTPHPAEFLVERNCSKSCVGPHVLAKKVTLKERGNWTRGYMTPYLGTKTKESTSILQLWEKHLEVPLLRRASDLRKAISWFVDPKSKLAESIYLNLKSLSGLD